MALEGFAQRGPDRRSRLMQRKKVYSVTTINQVAKDFGIEEDLLHDISLGMDREDGVIWVYGLTDDAVMAFTTDGVDELKNLLEMYHEDPERFRRP